MFPWGRAAIAIEVLFLGGLWAADLGAGPQWDETVSALVYHPTAALVTAAFVLHMAALFCLGAALRGWGRAGAWLAALGMALVVAFWTDAPGTVTWVGRVHTAGAILAFGGVMIAAWTRRVVQPIVPLSLLVVAGTLLLAGLARTGGLAVGITERAQLLIDAAWIMVAGASAPER